MNIALTGSSGIIGSKLLADLKEMGHNVICISSSTSNLKENIYSYEELELIDLNCKIDCLMHLASINSNLLESQVSLELELLKKVMLIMKKIECNHLIFFSTIKVYGENSFIFEEIDENSLLKPECFYGKAKKQCEEIIAQYAKVHSFNYLILRIPPILVNNPKSNIGTLFRIVKKGLPIPSFHLGNKNQRSFLSYDLLIHVLRIICDDFYKIKNLTLNISDSKPISTNELYLKIGKSLNKRVRIFYLPDILFQLMIRINRLQLICERLFGNFYVSNAKLKKEFKIPDNF
tara:strand:+ start:786 stop:1655 length:870 start_codon:yes stop_codon:yes gene_type:complete